MALLGYVFTTYPFFRVHFLYLEKFVVEVHCSLSRSLIHLMFTVSFFTLNLSWHHRLIASCKFQECSRVMHSCIARVLTSQPPFVTMYSIPFTLFIAHPLPSSGHCHAVVCVRVRVLLSVV